MITHSSCVCTSVLNKLQEVTSEKISRFKTFIFVLGLLIYNPGTVSIQWYDFQRTNTAQNMYAKYKGQTHKLSTSPHFQSLTVTNYLTQSLNITGSWRETLPSRGQTLQLWHKEVDGEYIPSEDVVSRPFLGSYSAYAESQSLVLPSPISVCSLFRQLVGFVHCWLQ